MFTSTFQYDATITAPSILFRSTEYYYPDGYTLLLFNQDGLILTPAQVAITPRDGYINDVEVLITDATLQGTNIEVVLIP